MPPSPALRRARPAIVLLLLAAGCVSRQGGPLGASALRTGSPGELVAPPPRPLDGEAWPNRLDVEAILAGPAPVLVVPPVNRPPAERLPIGRRELGILSRVDVERIIAPETLVRIRRDRGFREWIVFQTWLRLLPVEFYEERVEAPPTAEGDEAMRPLLVEISETSFAIYLPQGEPKGLVVQLTNLAGNTEWERRLTEEFHRRGWAVLSSFVPDGWVFGDRLELRRDDGPQRNGRRIAAAIDDRLAEWAFGVEAVLGYMAEAYPAVPQQPLLAVGSSAGAISLPAVAARLGIRFDAAVLIGGGADSLSVLRRTSLAATPLRISWTDRAPDAAGWEEIERVYLETARLDPLLTAPWLAQRPVLQLHAAWDRIVDASCGDRLWEALGRPERWSYQAGHLGLFVFWLPRETPRVVDWLERQIAEGRDAVESTHGGAEPSRRAE